jgi:hypothetical protein
MILEDDHIPQEHINEVLDLIVEECGEVVVARSKHRRFGPDSYHPSDPALDNWQALKTEMLDVYALTRALIRRGIIPHGHAEAHAERKIPRVLALHPHLRSIL